MTVIKQHDGVGDPTDPASWDTILVGAAGTPGLKGDTGDVGPPGLDGVGIPLGGTAGDVLTKATSADNDVVWSVVSGAGVSDGDKGDVIVTASGTAWSLDPSVVSTLARTLLDDVSYADMRTTLGVPSALTTIATSLPLTGGGDLSANRSLAIDEFDGTNTGVVPLSGGGTTNYLRADGTWAAPAGGGGGGVTASSTDTFTNKSVNLGTNTVTGTLAQFNAALTDADFYASGGATDVTVLDGGTGRSTGGTAYGLIAAGTVAAGIQQTIDPGTSGQFLKSAGSAALAGFAAIAEADVTNLVTDLAAKQPLDSDLTTIAGLTATTDNVIQSVGSAWASRTPAQLKTSMSFVKADVGLGSVDNTTDAAKPVSTATQTALDLKADLNQTINAQTGTTYTLVLTDNGKIVTLSNAAAITLTVPTNASVAFPVGASITLIQLAAGQFTVTGAGPPTISKAMATAKSRVQYSVMSLIKTATDVWVLAGDAAAS